MYQGRDTTGEREGLVTAFAKLRVSCGRTRRKGFPRGPYGLVRMCFSTVLWAKEAVCLIVS